MNNAPKFLALALLLQASTQTQVAAFGQIAAEEPSRVFGEVRKPVLVKRVEPECKWWKPHRSATSTLQVVIWKDGRITDIKVVKGRETAYTAAASEAIRKWQFRPATLNGQPVAVIVTFQVRGCWISDISYSTQ